MTSETLPLNTEFASTTSPAGPLLSGPRMPAAAPLLLASLLAMFSAMVSKLSRAIEPSERSAPP